MAATDDAFDWDKSDWTRTPIIKHADLKAIGSQQPVKCRATTKMLNGREAAVTISNLSQRVAYMQRVVLRDRKGQIIDGVAFSDNYLTIAPGTTKTVHCELPAAQKFSVDILAY